MTDQKLSALTAIGAEPSSTDEFYVNDAGTSKKILWSTIKAVFATAAQGALADSALQSSNIDTLAELNAIIGDATLGDSGDFATAAQGATADSAQQPPAEGAFVDGDKTKLDYISITQAVDLDAVEARVNQLDAAVILQGTWDASAGTFPGGGTAQAGDSYIVSVAGTVGGVAFAENDRIIAITDNASTSVYAANWHKADYTDQVLSVAGLTGAISASGLRTAINVEDGATATESLIVAVSDETTDLETGTAKLTFRMPYGFTLSGIRSSVSTAPVGADIKVSIHESGSPILDSNGLTIDAGQKTSTTSAVPASIIDASLADDAEITIDIDQIGSGTAGAGLKIAFIGQQS